MKPKTPCKYYTIQFDTCKEIPKTHRNRTHSLSLSVNSNTQNIKLYTCIDNKDERQTSAYSVGLIMFSVYLPQHSKYQAKI